MPTPYGGGPTAFVSYTSDYRIDSLLSGRKWGSSLGAPITLTYSFPASTSLFSLHPDTGYGYAGSELTQFSAMSAGQQAAVRRALAAWSEVANITFQEVPESSSQVGEMRFANSAVVGDYGAAAWAYYPASQPYGGDIWVDDTYAPNLWLDDGEFGYSVVLHEIGHALGLSHPFAGDHGPRKPVLPGWQDNERYSLMAYDDYSGSTIDAYGPMMYDILAIQHLYGANMSTRTGGDTYSFGAFTEYLEVIWDAGGHDSIDLSNQTRSQVIDLRAGSFSSIGIKNNGQTAVGNVGIALGVTIEDAIGGSGNDQITGNDSANLLDGQGGADRLAGGNGNDSYIVDDIADQVIETTGGAVGGADLVTSAVSFALGAYVESLTLTGTASIDGSGNALRNVLTGNEGANHLDGGGGDDTLAGLGSDDWIDGRTGSDQITGDDGNDSVVGGAGNDSLFGNAGNDTLDGGLGSDNLVGGTGNDLYVVNVAADSITEEGVDSDDQVRSTVGVNLAVLAGGLLEHATLLGAAAISAFGNGAINHLTGNNGANKLDGGIGADILTGGKGGDTYVVNEAGDQIIEDIVGTAGGIDTVQSSIDFDLTALVNVEKLTLAAGFAGLDGIGNGLNNTLTGNEGANTLNGGVGNDRMIGGAGDDYYFVDSTGDVVTETITNAKGGGIDTVESSVTYSLAARANVDHLTLTGSGNINGTGNALNNEITGNVGNNLLNGGIGNDTVVGNDGNDTLVGGTGNDTLTAGDGNDKLTGGTGNDIFDFNLVSELGDLDIITDFKKALDRIDIADLLDDALYAGSDIFGDGLVAFTYDKTTTNIWFDADGTAGGGSALSLASFQNVNLTSADSSSFIV